MLGEHRLVDDPPDPGLRLACLANSSAPVFLECNLGPLQSQNRCACSLLFCIPLHVEA